MPSEVVSLVLGVLIGVTLTYCALRVRVVRISPRLSGVQAWQWHEA